MECCICGSFYTPNKSSRQKTCDNPECKRELKRRARAKREGRKPADRSPRKCIICGETFTPYQHNQNTCSNFYCKREAKKRRAVARYNDTKRKEKTETCPICKRRYAPKRDIQKTCGSAACVAALGRKSRQVKRHCAFCSTPFMADPMSKQQHCSPGCKEEHQRREEWMKAAIPDPWPDLDFLPPECVSWYEAQMMPVI